MKIEPVRGWTFKPTFIKKPRRTFIGITEEE